ncbi:uncharacterized protein A1O5_07582 [Cladophialophora psammophila CBS 110553]|uniref:AB hydrolase-1 domain-containing protein n=1 Tax=Cladophialophora psammophila CBS 110553 TaxID=1182543 RepID=W9WY10_9EURO|nr:uncharacterized protein A1O5_07582 [Cladophialophora psammophila CBS 110553]EXJ69546.1 hypothetical protein A1O5_07582 [Cladophialophora psammophila CBS 110553]
MASSMSSIIIIPGSFTTAPMYYDLVDKIQALRGGESGSVFVNNLPSASRNPPEEPATLDDDAAFFRAIIEKLAERGQDVVVVAHSYGGVVGTEALKEVSKAEREARGQPGGVVRIVYLTAHVPSEGSSVTSMLGDAPTEMVEYGKDGFHRLVGIETIAQATFPDLELDKAVAVVKHMTRHSAVSFAGEITHAGYKHVPVSYIVCENDMIIPPEMQRGYIEKIQRESGRDVDVHTLNTGHAPNTTAPDQLANVIVRIAAAASA